MADTIVTNSPGSNDSGAAGWVVALVILLAVVIGGVVLYQRGFFGNTESADTTNIQITVPAPTGGNTNP